MPDNSPGSPFEEKLSAAVAGPGPDPAFTQRLRSQLLARSAAAKAPPRRHAARLAWAMAVGVAALLLLAFFSVGPQRVATAMRELLGYIPGVGVVEQNTSLRVLSAPVTAVREGITLTVQAAVLSPDKTVVLVTLEGIPAEALSRDESVVGCSDSPSLRLPDGTLLKITGGEGRGWGAGTQSRFVYPPIAADVAEATFVLPCIDDTLPGKAPENWELPLRFAPAPPDLTLVPVIDVSPSAEGATASSTPAVVAAASPEPASRPNTPAAAQMATATEAAPPYGIRLALDKFIPLDDGYYLIGHTTWTDQRLATVSPGDIKLLTAQGQEIPIETGYFGDIGIDQPEPNQWLYRVYGKVFNGPLTLRAASVGVEFSAPLSATLDLRPYGFDGSEAQLGTAWKIEPISLTVLDLQATMVQVKYIRQGDLKGFDITFQSDPALQSLPTWVVSGVTGGRGASSGGSSRDSETGWLHAYTLSDGQYALPLTLSTRDARLSGRWETIWTPPSVDPQLTPTSMPHACLTLEKWKQAAANPAPLPPGLGGKLAVYGRIKGDGLAPSPDNYGVFISNLDGSAKQVLGPGTWPEFSPDGTRAVYSGPAGLQILDLASGQAHPLPGTTPDDYDVHWSPDGKQMAFVRINTLFVVNSDGSGLRPVPGKVDYAQLIGWSADGLKLYYAVPGVGGQAVKSIDLATGAVQAELTFKNKGAAAALSPDGQSIAFVERVPGKMAGGLFVAPLDGSNRRLLAQLDYWGVGNPVWSPDGKWLIVSVVDTDQFSPASTPALINLETCKASPLAHIEGEVHGWVP